MDHGLTRRAALHLLGLGAAGGLVAACTPGAPPSPTLATTSVPAKPASPSAPPQPSPTSVAASAAASPAASVRPSPAGLPPPAAAPAAANPLAKRGGTLRVGQVGDVARLDGHLVSTVDTTWMPFDRLTSYDADLRPQPMLAESWEYSSDFKKLKLNLRKGVRFHSGRELTSDDIKWNLLYVRNPKVAAGALVLQSNWFASIDTPDKYTVVLGSDQPRPAAFDFFEYLNIVDSETAEGMQTLVGTGPFKFIEWVQGDHVLFTRNPDYWQAGLPYVDEVRVAILSDGQAMILQLESGALDTAGLPPLRDFARLGKDRAFTPWTVPSTTNIIGVNTTKSPTDNKLVRQALSYALDRDRIVSTIFAGTGDPMALPWEPGSLAYDASKNNAVAYDPEKARGHLAQAGLADQPLELVTLSGSRETDSLAQLYQSSLAALGITMTIKPYDTATYLDQINNRKYIGAYIGAVGYAALEPVTRLANSRHLDPSGNSNTGYTTPHYLQLFNAASSEPDTAKRKAIYDQINDVLLDEAFIDSISSAPARLLTRAIVKDVGLSKHGAFMYNAAWLDR